MSFVTDPSKWKDITPEMYDQINAEIEQTFDQGCHGQCSSCESGCSDQPDALPQFAARLYAVTGGKGGTGKSTVTVMLAYELARRGRKVGILDCDLANSAIPQLMGLSGRIVSEENKMRPLVTPEGIEVISYNLICADRNEPVLWPGLDMNNVVNYLYTGTLWGELDVLLLDMPTGAGDIPINLYSAFPVDGSVIVTQGGELAIVPTQRCITMTRMLLSAPVAFVENKALEEVCTAHANYDLPLKCLKLAMGLEPEITMLGDAGRMSEADCTPLAPICQLMENAVDERRARQNAKK